MSATVSVAIPTYRREAVLVQTLEHVLEQQPDELLVVDQSPSHEPATVAALDSLTAAGRIRWLRLEAASITGAMNRALAEATQPVVLFLDDDVVPAPGLLRGHVAAYVDDSVWAVAGQVLQPGQSPTATPHPWTRAGLRDCLDFPFNSTTPASISNAVACNMSVRRQRALALGGFDERYRGSAYRFETDFCRRALQAGGRVRFEPGASVRHLQAAAGGTRADGSFLTSASPVHGVGDYLFALTHGRGLERTAYISKRLLGSLAARRYLTAPWWIPVRFVAEVRALAWAVGLTTVKPRLRVEA